MPVLLPYIETPSTPHPDCYNEQPHGIHTVPSEMLAGGLMLSSICHGRDAVAKPGDTCWCCLTGEASGTAVCGHRTPMMAVPMCEACRTSGHEIRSTDNRRAHEHPGQEQYV